MEQAATNGFHSGLAVESSQPHLNGIPNDSPLGLPEFPSIEQLEGELPVVQDGQIFIGDLLSRVVQSIYAELTVLAET